MSNRRSKPLLVGVSPRPGTPGDLKGVAFVATDSGQRLARLLELPGSAQLPRHFHLINVYRQPDALWDDGEARRRAKAICQVVIPEWNVRQVVLFSGPVAKAFGLSYHPLLTWQRRHLKDRAVDFAVCPHPSGLTRWWNEAENRWAARRFFHDLCGLPEGWTPEERVVREVPGTPADGRGRTSPGYGRGRHPVAPTEAQSAQEVALRP